MRLVILLIALLFSAFSATLRATAQPPKATPGNRLAYLDELDPYYPHAKFPKLITPQWVGEEGVEAVVILAIDDMRDPAKYETFLRPILRRLQKIDGRAPVSIMTCSVNPKDPQLQTWLKEGLSIECHTIDHPCPFFKIGFEKAKSTYDRCVDLMNDIPGNKPVAFRMPCCDSLNTPSPRFWAEIFNRKTYKRVFYGGENPVLTGNCLDIDSSVFVYFTSEDRELPQRLFREGKGEALNSSRDSAKTLELPESLKALGASGQGRFQRYIPVDRSFVNTIANYPYPYLISDVKRPDGTFCWEFPCMTPSDWQAQHLQKPNNPKTVDDWKAALDCTVIKQGVMTMVFHPHGWIRNDQLMELIDYAVATHGKKVKFLTFKEAMERINKNLLHGSPVRNPLIGGDNGVRILDLNNDGYLDVIIANENEAVTRVWQPSARKWKELGFPCALTRTQRNGNAIEQEYSQLRFGILDQNRLVAWDNQLQRRKCWELKNEKWQAIEDWYPSKGDVVANTTWAFGRLCDIDGDGRGEMVTIGTKRSDVFRWDENTKSWVALPFEVPFVSSDRNSLDIDDSFRLLDLNADGKLDVIFSNEREYGIYLFTDMDKGWSKKILHGKRGEPEASATGVGAAAAAATGPNTDELPMISRSGQNNGFWVHSGYLWWSNEDTVLLKDHVDRRKIADLLRGNGK